MSKTHLYIILCQSYASKIHLHVKISYVQYSFICQKQICMSELHCYVKNTLQLVGMSKLTIQLTISLHGQSDPYMYMLCRSVYIGIGYIYCKKLSVVLTFCGYLSVHILL